MTFFKRIIRRFFTELKLFLPIKNKNINEEIIVSLTSYPARLNKLHLVIRSLLHQKMLPRYIILYLGNDTKTNDIPKSLKKLQKYNFIIKENYEDLKPHKKYFYAMQEFSDKIIITVDDDLIYDENLISDLYNSYKKYPNCVSARRVHKMTQKDNKIESYNNWLWEYKNELNPSHSLLATGCGGVLYPAHIFPKETFNKDDIKKYCLNTDDIWLKFMELKNDIKVVFTNSKIIHPLTIRNSQDSGLMHTNTSNENRNDINIKLMEDFTKINLAKYVEN